MAISATHYRLEKDAREKALIPFKLWVRTAGVVMAAMLCLGAGRAVEDVAQLQARFDQEKDGVRKAKLIQKLGDAQFNQEREAAKANDYVTVGLVMEKYRDNVRETLQALKKTRPDAEKHPSGYKQLEIHVGRGLREVRDVILVSPEPYRPPMLLVEQELKDMDMELLRLLFPRRPGEKAPPPLANGSTNSGQRGKAEKQP
jgi:hypothetical protein